MIMATSSFTSSVTINRRTAKSIKRVLDMKNVKPNTKNAKNITLLQKEDIKKFTFK